MKKIYILASAILVISLITGCSTKIETDTPNAVIEDTDEKEKDEEKIEEPKVIHDTESFYTILLGAETFTELTGDKGFIDRTEDGEEYLVIYLELGNRKLEDNYIHYDFLRTETDGRNIDTTFLMNKPKNYETILTNIPAETVAQGYLVYKVPVGWEKVSITYFGWGTDAEDQLNFDITRDDLKEVEPYVNLNEMP